MQNSSRTGTPGSLIRPSINVRCIFAFRSLDEVELDDINDGKTLTGLRPVFTDELTEEHDEMMREALAEEGAEYSFNPEEVSLHWQLYPVRQSQKNSYVASTKLQIMSCNCHKYYVAELGSTGVLTLVWTCSATTFLFMSLILYGRTRTFTNALQA